MTLYLVVAGLFTPVAAQPARAPADSFTVMETTGDAAGAAVVRWLTSECR
jgi:hypothetical protein